MAQFPLDRKIENYVKIELQTNRSAAVPGESFTLAVIQNIPEGWHTYWKNPGDSGAETRFEFDLPEGFEITDIKWPTPERIPYDILMNFGYEDQAVFLVDIKVPDQIDAYHVKLALDSFWLVCKDICIPEDQRVEIMLPVKSSAKAENDSLFEKAQLKLPIRKNVNASYKETEDNFILSVPRQDFSDDRLVAFFPEDYGLIENAPDQTIVTTRDKIVLSAPRGTRDLSDIGNSDFVLVSDGGSYQITAMASEPVTALPTPPPQDNNNSSGFLYHVLLALFGGIILNLMPCVFPVLSLKALSVVKLKDQDKKDTLMHGVFYTSGILISFAAFGGFILALRETGTALGWGFHLQNPVMILFLSYLMFAIGLNLLGLYTIAGRFMNWGQGLGNNKTKTGSFFTGVLAALVATPCTAPFMAAAVGYATIQPALQSMIIFLMVGLGLALPYLLLTISPTLQKILPRPGAWMETFKKILAVPMFLTTIWLLWVLVQQAGTGALYFAVIGIAILAIILWQKRFSVMMFGILVLILTMPMLPVSKNDTPLSSNSWDADRLQMILDKDQPVFVNMTASWCITCKINEKTTLATDEIKSLFDKENIVYLVGDWTNEDDAITQYLLFFNRNGVPLYVFYPAPTAGSERPEPIVLPQILTPTIVKNAVTR